MSTVARAVVCSGRGATGNVSSVLRGASSVSTVVGGASSASTVVGGTGSASTVLRGAGSASTVLPGSFVLRAAGSASTVLPGSSVLHAAGSASTVLRDAGTGSTLLRAAGTGSTLLRAAGTGSTLLRAAGTGSTLLRAAGIGSTLLRAAGIGSTLLRAAGTGSTLLRGTGTGSAVLGGLRDPVTGSSGRGTGISLLARAPGSHRPFSSSSSSSSLREKLKTKWQKHKPGEDTMIVCTLLGACGTIYYLVDTGYKYVLKESQSLSKAYIDEKLKEMQTEHKHFQNIATGTHHEFVRKCNEATADMQARMLALEAKEFKHRKELQLAAEILRKAELDAAAAKSAEQ